MDVEKFEDKTLTCKDCGAKFVFTAGEQSFYAEKGFENEPQRCASCRRARKSGAARVFHDAVCAKCGGNAKVPFQPQEGKPVYCSDCFSKVKETQEVRG